MKILRNILGIGIGLVSIGLLFSKPISGIVGLIFAISFLPKTWSYLSKKYNLNIPKLYKILIVVVLLFVFFSLLPQSAPQVQNVINNEASSTTNIIDKEKTQSLNGGIKFSLDKDYGFGVITVTNKDSFDWKDCVFSVPLAKTNPLTILKGDYMPITASDFFNDPEFNNGGKQMTMDDGTFRNIGGAINVQCSNGQSSIDNVAKNFSNITVK